MMCPHCKGSLQSGTAPFHADRAGYHVQWDAVPAWVCDQCGEAVFESEQVEAIQHALAALDTHVRLIVRAG